MEIKVIKKSVYGQELVYVEDAEQARAISGLTGRKTLTTSDLINLEKLGHIITE